MMEAVKFVGFFIQHAILPSVALMGGAYFVLFTNTRVEKGKGLRVFGNAIVAIALFTAFAVFSSGIYSIGLYNKKMAVSVPGMAKGQGVPPEMIKAIKMKRQQNAAEMPAQAAPR